jgi:hypothetical protein
MMFSIPSPSLRQATVAGVAGAGATTAAAFVLRTAGVHLAVGGQVPLAAFAQFTLIGAALGGLLLAVVERHSVMPRRRFLRIAVTLTGLTLVAPIALADGAASKIGLVATHLVAAAIIVPVLARQITD